MTGCKPTIIFYSRSVRLPAAASNTARRYCFWLRFFPQKLCNTVLYYPFPAQTEENPYWFPVPVQSPSVFPLYMKFPQFLYVVTACCLYNQEVLPDHAVSVPYFSAAVLFFFPLPFYHNTALFSHFRRLIYLPAEMILLYMGR